MEWLGVLLMMLVAILAAGMSKGMVRLLYIVAPVKVQDVRTHREYHAAE